MVLCDDFLVIKKKHVLHKSLKEIGSNLIVMEPHCHLEKITISRALFYTDIIFDTNRQSHYIEIEQYTIIHNFSPKKNSKKN